MLINLNSPGWEVEIGTSQGKLEHRNTFKRKIDPVVNGVSEWLFATLPNSSSINLSLLNLADYMVVDS